MLSFNKKVAIHQPNYLPWIGFFYKIYLCDHFVFLDDVELSKKAPTRRTKIKSPSKDNGSQWLTIPLIQHTDYAYISSVQIANNKIWADQHIAKIETVYGKEAYYAQYSPIINEWIRSATEFESMSKFNQHIIVNLSELLGIAKPLSIAKLTPAERQDKTQLNKSIVQKLGGQTYISGSGGQKYLDELAFSADGIHVVYYNAKDILSKHQHVNFHNAILEPLYILGVEEIRELFKSAAAELYQS